jgi:hypothetical protein
MLQNFFPHPNLIVTIGNVTCGSLEVTDLSSFTTAQCVAPTLRGSSPGESQLVVFMPGSGSASQRFAYNPPVVSTVSGSPCTVGTACPIMIVGSDLGLRDALAGPNTQVFVGLSLCLEVNVMNSSTVYCSATSTVVGRFPVVVSLAGQNSSDRIALRFFCDSGFFGLPGQPCIPCPKVTQHAFRKKLVLAGTSFFVSHGA